MTGTELWTYDTNDDGPEDHMFRNKMRDAIAIAGALAPVPAPAAAIRRRPRLASWPSHRKFRRNDRSAPSLPKSGVGRGRP